MPQPYWHGYKVDYNAGFMGGPPAGSNGGITGPAISTFEAHARKQAPIQGINARWLDNGIAHPFSAYTALLTDCFTHNRIAYMDWGVWDLANQTNSVMVNYANIINGAFATLPDGFTTIDSFITSWATACAAFKHSFFIRIFHEMNLNSNQWAWSLGNVTVGGNSWTNSAAQHIAAWEHIFDIFQAVGATNATFVWCPNSRSSSGTGTFVYPYASIVPNLKKIHWFGLDNYTNDANQELEDQFRGVTTGNSAEVDSVAELRALGGQPIGIWETGVRGSVAGVLDRAARATEYTNTFETGIPTNLADVDLICWFMTYYDSFRWTPDFDGSLPTSVDTVAYAKGAGGTNQVGVNITLPPDMQPIAPYAGTPQREPFVNAVLNTYPLDLQGYWKHDEPSGTQITDYSGNARHGTYTGAGILLGQPKVVPGSLDTSALYDGVANYGSVPHNNAFSLFINGVQTILATFTLASLPAVLGSVFSKAASSNDEFDLGVSSTGAIVYTHWNQGGSTYLTTSTVGGVVVVGVPMLVIVTLDQARSPVGRRGWAVKGASSMTFNNTADTLGNAPTAVTSSAINFGRRGQGGGDRFLNVYDAHMVSWSIALSDLSCNVLLKEFNRTRRLPRSLVGSG